MGNCYCTNECRYNEETEEFIFNPKLIIKLSNNDNLNDENSFNIEVINKKFDIQKDDKLDRVIDKIVIKIIKDENLYLNNKEIDIVYMIDSTGSMGQETKMASTLAYNNSINLKNTYPQYSFQFGIIFYNDPIDVNTDSNSFKQLTENLEEIKHFCDNWANQSGGDGAEDWVGGYTLALEKINWRNKDKIIFHICDAPAHGEKYSKNSGDNHKDKIFEIQLDNIMKRCAKENYKIIGLPKNLDAKNCFIECKKMYDSEGGSFFIIREYKEADIGFGNLNYGNAFSLNINQLTLN